MKISIITLFPKMINGFFEESILKKAQEKGLIELEIINLRDFATDSHKTVDDRPYGGGAGMVLRADILNTAIKSVKDSNLEDKEDSQVILTSARGKIFNQKMAKDLSALKHLIIICGHYEGFDERIMSQVDQEISIGDFILTGGEIPASLVADAVTRLIPGVLKKEDATQNESFFFVTVDSLIEICGEDEVLGFLKKNNIQQVQLVEYPHYTRPEIVNGEDVPEVLKKGNHKDIYTWRIKKAYSTTKQKRSDLLMIKP